MTIRRQLKRLVAAIIVPAVLAAGLLSAYSYNRQRTNVEQRTLETARALTQAVDRELASGRTALQALATSPYLDPDLANLAAFHRQASEAMPDLPGNNIVLSDASGQQLVNTLRPFGEVLPRHGNPAQLRSVFEAGEPVISDLYVGGVTRRALVGVDVPVRREGRVIYDMSMGFLPVRLGEILTRQNLPAGWVASIFDSHGTIVARTHDPARYVGQKGAAGLLERMTNSPEGQVDVQTLEGIPVVAVFSHSAVSNWSVAIGIPSAVLAAYLWKPLLLILGGTVVLLALGLSLAQLIGARITRSIRALVAPAVALGRGEKVIVPPLEIAEVAEVGQALASGSKLLSDRERVLAVVAHDLRNPLSTLTTGIAFASLLTNRLPGGERVAQEFDMLSDVVRRMSGMVDDLLAVAVSAEAERSMLRLASVSASSLVTRAANAVRGLFAERRIELRVDSSRVLPAVQADADRVLRVFVNLLDNALKFTDAPGEVVLRAEADAAVVRFSVANSGPALSRDELDAMFRPFWQAGPDDRRGTGLGLSICESIIKTHGGRIWAEAEPGKRVRICFELPRATAATVPGQRADSVQASLQRLAGQLDSARPSV